MIADWTVDVGGDSPTIDVPWSGWVDLRREPLRVRDLVEAIDYPELRPLLARANTAATLTSKIDVFPVDRDDADPEIAELGPEQAAHGLGSYIDLLTELPIDFVAAEAVARSVVKILQQHASPACAVELVVRGGRLYDNETFGWTLYAMGFAPSTAAARQAWASASGAALDAWLTVATRGE